VLGISVIQILLFLFVLITYNLKKGSNIERKLSLKFSKLAHKYKFKLSLLLYLLSVALLWLWLWLGFCIREGKEVENVLTLKLITDKWKGIYKGIFLT